jgi:hypothetical protein
MVTFTPQTIFTRDVLGQYVCNTFTEATQSGAFDVIIVGGGTFGLALAQDLFTRGRLLPPGEPTNLRFLVLEAGHLVFREHVQDIPNLQVTWPTITKADPATLLHSPGGAPGTPPIVTNPPIVINPLAATRRELLAAGVSGPQPLLETWGLPRKKSCSCWIGPAGIARSGSMCQTISTCCFFRRIPQNSSPPNTSGR